MSTGPWNDLTLELSIPAATAEHLPLITALTLVDGRQMPPSRLTRLQRREWAANHVIRAFTGDYSALTVSEQADGSIKISGDGSYVPSGTAPWLQLLAAADATGTATVIDGQGGYSWELDERTLTVTAPLRRLPSSSSAPRRRGDEPCDGLRKPAR